MTFPEFIEEIKFYLVNEFGHDPDRIKFLPEGMTATTDYEATIIADTNLRYFDRESESLLGNFLITEWPEGPVPSSIKEAKTIERFFLDALYQDCQKDGFPSVLERLRKGKEESVLSKKSDTLEHANDYQITKVKLILRPLNYKNNRNILKRHVYRRIGDIALVVYMIIAHENGNYMTAKLPKETIDEWGKTEDEVVEDALRNTQRLHPAKAAKIVRDPVPRFVDLGLLESVPAAEFHNVSFISLFGQDNPNGAITLFFPGMLNWLYEKVGGAYYVVFTSIEDVAIHSVKVSNLKELKYKLSNLNANLNRPEDILSRRVYKYDGKELVEMD